MPANMSIFHAGGIYRSVVFTGKYQQILVNAGKYWKLAFTTLELRQNPTLAWSFGTNNCFTVDATGTGFVVLFNNSKEVPSGIFLLHDE